MAETPETESHEINIRAWSEDDLPQDHKVMGATESLLRIASIVASLDTAIWNFKRVLESQRYVRDTETLFCRHSDDEKQRLRESIADLEENV